MPGARRRLKKIKKNSTKNGLKIAGLEKPGLQNRRAGRLGPVLIPSIHYHTIVMILIFLHGDTVVNKFHQGRMFAQTVRTLLLIAILSKTGMIAVIFKAVIIKISHI